MLSISSSLRWKILARGTVKAQTFSELKPEKNPPEIILSETPEKQLDDL